MSTATQTPTLKEHHRATWAAGNYAAVAERLVLEIGRRIVTGIGVGPESEVLDVATGTGNAAIPAAGAGARVVGLDLVPELLAVARRRAREAGVEVEWVVGDAEDLPFEGGRFDIVLSTLGVQFTPDHRASALELARVCRVGGRIGLANWTPQGYIGRFFATMSPYMPPPPRGASPPPLWGSEEHVAELFAGTGVRPGDGAGERRLRPRLAGRLHRFHGRRLRPAGDGARAAHPQGRWEDLRADLVRLSESSNAAGDGTFLVASEYLVVTGDRREAGPGPGVGS